MFNMKKAEAIIKHLEIEYKIKKMIRIRERRKTAKKIIRRKRYGY